jgi:hypothetical protein
MIENELNTLKHVKYDAYLKGGFHLEGDLCNKRHSCKLTILWNTPSL